jgi:hypothetical protein
MWCGILALRAWQNPERLAARGHDELVFGKM